MSDRASPYRRDALLLGLLALILFAWRAASLPLFDLDEGAFSEATRELLASGDWLMTYLNGEPRYDKPILTYWLQAISVLALGQTELAFRLPSILAGTGWVLLIHAFVYERGGARAAVFAAGSAALAAMVGVIGHAATADALLNLCIAATLLDIWRWLEVPSRAVLARVFVWLALGTLTKGPVAVAIPLVVSLLQCLWTRRLRDFARAVFWLPGWAIWAAIVLPWAVTLTLRDHGDFMSHFLLKHNVGRYTQTLESHGGHWWYYFVFLPLVLLPFAGLLPTALIAGWRRRREPLVSFLLIWFGVVFALFSFSSTQLPHYVLYGCTPLFVLFGRRYRRPAPAAAALLPGIVFAVVLAALPLVLALIKPPKREFDAGIVALARTQLDAGYVAITMAVLLAMIVVALLRRPLWQRLLGIGALQAVAVWVAFAPVLGAAQQAPVRDAGLQARALGGPAVAYRIDMPSFSVYRDAITPKRVPAPGELVFTRRDRIDDLQRELPGVVFETLRVEGGIALLRRPADAASGATPAPAPPSMQP